MAAPGPGRPSLNRLAGAELQMTLRLSLMFTVAVGLMLVAPLAAANDHDDSDGAVPAIPCQTDDDCPEDVECVDEYCAWESDGDDNSCTTEADCTEDEICVWGSCQDPDGWCETDEDCGEYLECKKSFAPTPANPPNSTEPAPPPDEDGDGDGDGGGGTDSGPDNPEGDSTDEPADDSVDPPQENAWGRCVVDPESLPETQECADFCALAVECGEVGSGSSSSGNTATPDEAPPAPEPADGDGDDGGSGDDDGGDAEPPGGDEPPDDDGPDEGWDDDGASEEELAQAEAFCGMMCNYAEAIGVATDEFDAVLACVDGLAEADICEDLEDVCEDEGEAWAEALEDAGALEAVLGSADFGSVGTDSSEAGGDSTGAPRSPDPGGDGDSAPQDEGTSGGGANGDSGGLSESDGPTDDAGAGGGDDGGADGGCTGGGGPAMPLLALLTLCTMFLVRRRGAV